MTAKAFTASFLLLSCFALFCFPAPLSRGMTEGFERLITHALPALFPYMVVTSFLRKSGSTAPLSRLLSPLTTRLFGVGRGSALPLLTALLAGYPVSISLTCALVREGKLSKNEGKRLLLFCANPSPAFLIAGVGVGMFNNAALGILLYITLTLSAMLVGILQNLCSPPLFHGIETADEEACPLLQALVLAVRESVISMAYVGGFLLFFSSLSALFSLLPLPSSVGLFLIGFTEITGGVFSLPPDVGLLPTVAFLCGFGGLCVAAQSTVFIREADLSPRRYFFGRLTVGILSALLTAAMLKIST